MADEGGRSQRRKLLVTASVALPSAIVVTGGTCAVLVLLAPPSAQMTVAVGCSITALVLSVAVALAAVGVHATRLFRRRVHALDAEATGLIDETLPELARRLRDGATMDAALAAVTQPNLPAHQRILHAMAEQIAHGERMRAAAMTTCANAAGRVQAMATSMLADLREMENRHDEEVLGDLLKLDHSTAQVGRLADSIAVLTGARSGRRWAKPIGMESVLRGAMGRIGAYQRVRLHCTSTVAIVGYAAEGVMHALAELMDNATTFSPPSEEVHVYVEETQAGVVVTIEDGGLVMSDHALQRAERAVSSEPLDLTTFSGSRLGLAVVGCLGRKYGLTVSFRPSSRGGTGVVVLVPRELISAPPLAANTGSTNTGSTNTEAADAADRAEEPGVDELPRRRRGQTLAATAATVATASTATPSPELPDAGARFGAFRGVSGEPATQDEQ